MGERSAYAELEDSDLELESDDDLLMDEMSNERLY